MHVPTTLREARRRAGLSQAELAASCGVKQPAISRIEKGTVAPGVGTLELLLHACGESLEATPRLGIGVDRTLLHDALRRPPAERLQYAVAAARALAKLRAASVG